MATNSKEKADLKKTLPLFAKNLNSIKLSLTKLVKNKEDEKKQRAVEKQRQRVADYASKYKKVFTPSPAEKKVVAQEKKSFLESIKDFFGGLLKFLILGLGAIGLSKLLSNPAVTTAITDFLKKVFISLSEALQKGMQIVTNLINNPEVFATIQKLVKETFLFIGNLIVKGADFIRDLASDSGVQSTIKDVLVGIISTVKEIIASIFSVGKKMIGENREIIKTTIIDILVAIANAFVKALKFTTEIITDPRIKAAIVEIAYALRDAIKIIFNTEFEVGGVKLTLKKILFGLGAAVLGFGLALTALQAAIIGGMVRGNLPGGGKGSMPGNKPGGKMGAAGTLLQGAALLGTGYVVGKEAYETFFKEDPSLKQHERYLSGDSSSPVVSSSIASDTTSPTRVPPTVQSSSAAYYDPQKGGEAIREVIGAGEGGRTGYNATYGFGYGKQDPRIEQMFGAGKKLTDLSINEVLYYTTKRGANQGAVGKYQFMPDVLRGLTSKASGYGISFESKFTPEVQDKLYSIFSQANVDRLKKNNIPITPENIHLAHSVGAGGAIKLIKNQDQNANVLEVLGLKGEQAKTNPHLNTSIANYRATLAAKYGGQGGTTLASKESKPTLTSKATEVATAATTAVTTAATEVSDKVSSVMPSMAGLKEPIEKISGGMPDVNIPGVVEKPKNMIETFMESISEGIASLDKITGGKLGFASTELQAMLRDKSFLEALQSPVFADASKNISTTDSVAMNEKTPSVYDDVLLSKLSRT